MNIGQLIAYDLPVLSLDDTGDRAMHLMNEFRVFHLPLVQRDNYLALISEDDLLDWDTPEETLSLADFITFRPAVVENMHPFEAMKLTKEFNLSVVPVVDENNHYVGLVSSERLLNYLTDSNTVIEPGAILILEMEHRNYSLSEISRICESNDISILGLFVKTDENTQLQQVTIKTNKTDIQALLATFERFNYHVVEVYASENSKEDLQHHYDQLMRYMNP
ncbi:MAG: CBS domain-containing protein [Chitinophagaceae bacterium]|nr:CBS domain-containing protein [Chitinophagaceae bacterium]